MTRVDFYIVGPHNRSSVELVACRLTAKAFEQGQGVFLMVESDAAAERLDDLLWTFRDISFVPHQRLGEERWPDTRIVVGAGEPPPTITEVMINLRHPVSPVFSRFDRVIEIVPSDPAHRDAGRARYRYYQERGYALNTRDLD